MGINQFPNPPMKAGMTRKKIIRNACAVMIVLKAWFPKRDPGVPSSVRIKSLIDVPAIPAQMAIIKYSVPISLWLVDVSHCMWISDVFAGCVIAR